MWQAKLAVFLGAIIIGTVLAIGSVAAVQRIEQKKHTKRTKPKNNDETDMRSEYCSVSDPSENDDVYYSAEEEMEEESDLMTHLHNMDQNLGYDNESLLEENFNKLKEFQEKFPNNYEILWRLARCCHFLSTYFEKQKREWITEGCMYANESLKIKKTADTLQWVAMLEGRKCLFCGFSERIKFASIFKQHIEEAISLRPEDAFLHYLLANYYYQTIFAVPYIFKKVVENTIGMYTIEDALHHAFKAEKLSSRKLKQNKLLIAKCLLYKHNKENKQKVLDLLHEALRIEVITPEDREAHEEILTLIKS